MQCQDICLGNVTRNEASFQPACERLMAYTLASKPLLSLPPPIRITFLTATKAFSVLNRPPPNYEGHVPLNVFERGALAAGSAVMSLLNPRRAGMIDLIASG